MNKPNKIQIECYDYFVCRDYLQNKYEYNECDYFGKFSDKGVRIDVEYANFWHFLLEHNEINNGSFFIMCRDLLELSNEWQRKILNYYFDEFGDEIYFYISW